MAIRPKRASMARVVIGLASLAFPLIATGAAQAAIAGATPATTTQRPDLRSATINPTAGDGGVEVCFDKVLNTIGAGPSAFHLVGYRAGNVSAAATTAFIDQTNTQCAIVMFPTTGGSAVGDLTQYTAVTVSAGAVIGNSALALNLDDSVGLTGSTSHAGTTGVTTGPNLVGVLAPTGTNIATNSLTFVFDKAANVVDPTRFFYVSPSGVTCNSTAVLSGDGTTTITVTFAACGGPTVATAARAGAFGNPGGAAVVSTSDPTSENPDQSVVLPNAPNGGATQVPDLVSAVINADQDTVTYTFDKNVVLNGAGVGNFRVETAIGGTPVSSTGAIANGGTTVTARFSGKLSVSSEFGVIAWVFPDAVKNADNTTGPGNAPGSANVGDNAGAFARAFTTGPDVFGVTASKSTGTVTVNVDDRISSTNPAGGFTLYDTTGNVIAAPAPAVSFNSSAPPGPAVVTLQYPASSLTNLGSVGFNFVMAEPAGTAAVFAFNDAVNIPQIVSPVSSAAILKGYKSYKAHHHSSHKKHTKKHTKKH